MRLRLGLLQHDVMMPVTDPEKPGAIFSITSDIHAIDIRQECRCFFKIAHIERKITESTIAKICSHVRLSQFKE